MGLDVELPPLGEASGRGFYTSCGNAVSVAIPQPRVAGEARYPGYPPHQPCNAVSVAISRRRYPQGKIIKCSKPENVPSWENYHKI